jgi:hypothetical protein
VGVAEYAFAVGEGALEQGEGLVAVAGGLVGGSEVVAGGEGVGVGVAEHLREVGEGRIGEDRRRPKKTDRLGLW